MAKALGSGVSVMRAELDAATTTSVDAHEAQWRAGVNRQAQAYAGLHQHAASLAAAEKRRAGAMTGEEREKAGHTRALIAALATLAHLPRSHARRPHLSNLLSSSAGDQAQNNCAS